MNTGKQPAGAKGAATGLRHYRGRQRRSRSEHPLGPSHLGSTGTPAASPNSWLEAGGTEVQRVLRAERRYAEGWLARSAALTEALHGEMLAEVPPAQVCGH